MNAPNRSPLGRINNFPRVVSGDIECSLISFGMRINANKTARAQCQMKLKPHAAAKQSFKFSLREALARVRKTAITESA